MSEFPLYALTEEHQAVREAVRAVCDAKVAPYAAAVDEEIRYPQEAAEALLASDFHAPHVPEEYGGAGADALATCLVIEEVARACVSSSLIPAVNKLGSLPVILAGSEELKQHYLTKLAAGEGGFSYCLSEPDAGSDAGGMTTKAVRDGDHWVLNGVKRWITNAEVSDFYTVMAVTDTNARRCYVCDHDALQVARLLNDGYAAQMVAGRRGMTSRKVVLVKGDSTVDCGLRIRVTSNNGIKAFLGLSKANKNSSIVLKLQQDRVDNLVATADGVQELTF